MLLCCATTACAAIFFITLIIDTGLEFVREAELLLRLHAVGF